MPTIHPTTSAIIAGLHGEAPTGSALEQGLTLEVSRLARETFLGDAEEIANAGLTGWDLGFRQEGTRYEITARFCDDRGYEMLLTAMIDRKKDEAWSYVWLVQSFATAFSRELYPNGMALSFLEAMALAFAKIERT